MEKKVNEVSLLSRKKTYFIYIYFFLGIKAQMGKRDKAQQLIFLSELRSAGCTKESILQLTFSHHTNDKCAYHN